MRVGGLGCFGEEQAEISEGKAHIALSEKTSRKRIQRRKRGGFVAGSSRLTISVVVRGDNWPEGGLRDRWSMEKSGDGRKHRLPIVSPRGFGKEDESNE